MLASYRIEKKYGGGGLRLPRFPEEIGVPECGCDAPSYLSLSARLATTSAVRVCLYEIKATGCRPARHPTPKSCQQTGAAGLQFRCAASCSRLRSRPTDRESGGMSLNAIRTAGGARFEVDTILPHWTSFERPQTGDPRCRRAGGAGSQGVAATEPLFP